MALVEVFHLVASELPIDATASPDIPQGSVVVVDSTTGYVTVASATADDDNYVPIGLAGDSRSSGITSWTPESGSALNTHTDSDGDGTFDTDNFDKTSANFDSGALVTGAWGTSERFTQNHVADNYNEVLASGKMTVYHSGGEFWTDMFLLADSGAQTYSPGDPVFMTGNTGSNLAGKITSKSPGSSSPFAYFKNRVGIVLKGNLQYPSGVPGTETPFLHLNEGGNSLSYGQFILIKLCI